MDKLLMCRVCLNENGEHVIVKTHLQEVYEKLTSMPLQTNDMRPLSVCYVCYARLNKSHKLMVQCVKADNILTQMISQVLNSEEEEHQKPVLIDRFSIKFTNLIISSTEMINIESTVPNTEIKEEGPVTFEQVKKEDLNETAGNVDSDHFNDGTLSDSEDDIPLKNIIKDIEGIKKEKKIARVRRRGKNDLKKGIKNETREIMLSRDQQMADLLARSKSNNYLNSPFKCEHCYKGFVSSKAYDNHREKHDERSGPFSCDICRMRYFTKQQLKTHAITAHERIFRCHCGHISHTANQARVHEKWHNGYTYECQLCSHKFNKPTSYLSHVRKRHPTEHVCNICGESFVGKHGLQMHKTKTHRNNDVTENSEESALDRFCTECNIQFYTVDAWKRHILCSVKHTLKNENSSQCKICGWRILGSVSLATHMKEHKKSLRQKRPPPQARGDVLHLHCQQCGANFVNRSKLQSHINRIHLGLKYNKNIVCEVCGKKCTSNATLKYHQRTHTGERPYSCTTCLKQFPDSNQLRIHTRIHTGERPYVCTVCGKRFSQKPALNRHYRVHTGVKPYTCQYCSRTFSQSNSLKLHVRTVHLKLPANNRKNKRNPAEITENAQNVDIAQKDV